MNKKLQCIIVMLMITFCTVFSVHTFCTGGYIVMAEGKVIGFVENKEDVLEITDKFNEQLESDYGSDAVIDENIEYIKKTDLKKNITSVRDLEKNISSLSELLTEAYVLIIDGKDSIAFADYKTLVDTLEIIRLDYVIDDGVSEICEDITYRTEYISKSQIYTQDMALDFLRTYSLLNVKTTVKIKYTGASEYEIIKKEDNTMYRGSTVIEQEGEPGESIYTAEVWYINGEENNRVVVDEEVVVKAVPQIEKIGTLDPPPGYGTGEFIMPVQGRLTSEYGQRWGRLHGGIDVAAPTGTKINASDTGTVIFSGESGSYGLVVKLDHGNGYVTYYAHCSKLYVKKGDIVNKGQLIALVGNTGNSTGSHCHFEIRYNNKQLDPFKFIK